MAELIIGVAVLATAITSLLAAFFGQITLTEHSRNFSFAVNDATRVLERLRQQNSGAACAAPSPAAPGGFASWDAWLADATANGGGGKSVQPNPLTNELVVTTSTGADPLQVTVAVCWRQRGRTLGECTWNGAQLTAVDLDGSGVITSPAMLSTLITCRR